MASACIVKLLIAKGIDATHLDKRGRGAFQLASACNGKLQTFPQWLRDNVKGAPKSRRPGAVSGRPITPNVVKLLVEHDTGRTVSGTG